jgi:hypothetical protein
MLARPSALRGHWLSLCRRTPTTPLRPPNQQPYHASYSLHNYALGIALNIIKVRISFFSHNWRMSRNYNCLSVKNTYKGVLLLLRFPIWVPPPNRGTWNGVEGYEINGKRLQIS